MNIFKAYDVRGIYPESIDEDIVYKIGRAYVIKFKAKKITIGRDMRISSPKLFKALVKGVTDQGCDVVDIGLVSTPMMYFSVWNYGYDGGLMVSASHNPPKYNGVKMVGEGGMPISGETGIYEIGKMINNLNNNLAGKKGSLKKLDIMDDYVKHSLNYLTMKLKRFKIIIDTANGMGGPVSAEFFKHLDCELIHLFSELDGSFPNHEANPLKEENVADLRKAVKENNADIGVGFDGDADRCSFIDENAEIVPSDLIVALVAKNLLEEKKGLKILYDVRCSRVVGEIIKENGGIPGRCRVGHSLVKKQMKNENAKFAGELSSHFYLQDEHYAEAPFFVILKLLELMTKENKTLSQLIEPLKKYYQSGEINSKVKDKQGKMKELAEKFKDGKVNWLDGVTVEFDDWWFNIRPSNTEPLLRITVEANNEDELKKRQKEVLNVINN